MIKLEEKFKSIIIVLPEYLYQYHPEKNKTAIHPRETKIAKILE